MRTAASSFDERATYLPSTRETPGAKIESEKDEAVRRTVIDAFANQRNAKLLIELARKETDVAMKKRILERLSQMRSAEATDYFMEILGQP